MAFAALAGLTVVVFTWLADHALAQFFLFQTSYGWGPLFWTRLAQLTSYANAPTLIALGMASFLAAVTQTPLTAFIIVMEMVDGHALVLSLMACAMVASGTSKLISAPLYAALAELQLRRIQNLPTSVTQKESA